MVVGYYRDKAGELKYIVEHWGFLYAYDARALFASTQNLKKRRDPEHYLQVPVWSTNTPYPYMSKPFWKPYRFWVDLEMGKFILGDMLDKSSLVRTLHLKRPLHWLGVKFYTSTSTDERITRPPNDHFRGAIATILGDMQNKAAFDDAMKPFKTSRLKYRRRSNPHRKDPSTKLPSIAKNRHQLYAKTSQLHMHDYVEHRYSGPAHRR